MSISTYAANKTLDKLFGNTTLSQPTTLYFGLSTTTPSADGTGVTEPSGSGYLRIGVTNSDKTNWTVAASASLSNVTAITFPESTGSWGTVVSVVIYDALTSGNLWFYDTLTPSRAVATSTTVYFAAAGVVISMT